MSTHAPRDPMTRPAPRPVRRVARSIAVALLALTTGAGCSTSASGATNDVGGSSRRASALPAPARASERAATHSASAPVAAPLPPGTYALWEKTARTVLFVSNGRVVRTAPTTGNTVKTPPGTYHIRYTDDLGSETIGGVRYTLPYFMEFGPVPGHIGIGLHADPVTVDGHYAQPPSTIGDPGYSSRGCLRLRLEDAAFAWHFLRVGSTVRVVP